jgi:hypothetical protein
MFRLMKRKTVLAAVLSVLIVFSFLSTVSAVDTRWTIGGADEGLITITETGTKAHILGGTSNWAVSWPQLKEKVTPVAEGIYSFRFKMQNNPGGWYIVSLNNNPDVQVTDTLGIQINVTSTFEIRDTTGGGWASGTVLANPAAAWGEYFVFTFKCVVEDGKNMVSVYMNGVQVGETTERAALGDMLLSGANLSITSGGGAGVDFYVDTNPIMPVKQGWTVGGDPALQSAFSFTEDGTRTYIEFTKDANWALSWPQLDRQVVPTAPGEYSFKFNADYFGGWMVFFLGNPINGEGVVKGGNGLCFNFVDGGLDFKDTSAAVWPDVPTYVAQVKGFDWMEDYLITVKSDGDQIKILVNGEQVADFNSPTLSAILNQEFDADDGVSGLTLAMGGGVPASIMIDVEDLTVPEEESSEEESSEEETSTPEESEVTSIDDVQTSDEGSAATFLFLMGLSAIAFTTVVMRKRGTAC